MQLGKCKRFFTFSLLCVDIPVKNNKTINKCVFIFCVATLSIKLHCTRSVVAYATVCTVQCEFLFLRQTMTTKYPIDIWIVLNDGKTANGEKKKHPSLQFILSRCCYVFIQYKYVDMDNCSYVMSNISELPLHICNFFCVLCCAFSLLLRAFTIIYERSLFAVARTHTHTHTDR